MKHDISRYFTSHTSSEILKLRNKVNKNTKFKEYLYVDNHGYLRIHTLPLNRKYVYCLDLGKVSVELIDEWDVPFEIINNESQLEMDFRIQGSFRRLDIKGLDY